MTEQDFIWRKEKKNKNKTLKDEVKCSRTFWKQYCQHDLRHAFQKVNKNSLQTQTPLTEELNILYTQLDTLGLFSDCERWLESTHSCMHVEKLILKTIILFVHLQLDPDPLGHFAKFSLWNSTLLWTLHRYDLITPYLIYMQLWQPSQAVEVGSTAAPKLNTSTGALQGCILSPFLNTF